MHVLGTPPAFVLSQDQTLHVLKRAWKHTNGPEGLSRLRSTHKNAWFPTLRSVRVRNFTLFPRLTHGKWHPCFEAHTSLTPSCQKAPARTRLGHVSRGIVILWTSSEPVKQPAVHLSKRSTLQFGQPRVYPPHKSCATPFRALVENGSTRSYVIGRTGLATGVVRALLTLHAHHMNPHSSKGVP